MISVLQLGVVDYATGLRLQQRLVELRKDGRIGDVLLLLEHTPVITLGRNAKAANVIASSDLLAQRGVEVCECDRGGDVTFHGPGQLVGYPIFDLRGFLSADEKRQTLGAVEYVRRLEEVLIRTCADFGIPTKRIPGLTGVWTSPTLSSRAEQDDPQADHPATSRDLMSPRLAASDETAELRSARTLRLRSGQAPEGGRPHTTSEAKIAALGVHISRGVTSHGFALNVSTDLSFFNLIIPCGITSKPVTSMEKELAKPLPLQDVAHSVSRNFGVVFSTQMLWLETLDDLLGHAVGVPMKPPAELRELHQEEDIFLA